MTHRLMTIWLCVITVGLSCGCSLIYDGEDLRGRNASTAIDGGSNTTGNANGNPCNSHTDCLMNSRATAPICAGGTCVSHCTNDAECTDHPYGNVCGGNPAACGCASNVNCEAPLNCIENMCMRP